MENNYLIVMAGGVGSRFWPYSTKEKPKQFLDVTNSGETLIQQTVDRFQGICPRENIFVVTNKRYSQLVREQLPGLESSQILTEPVSRNTAPCIAYAAYKIKQKNPNANLIVTPADHIIKKRGIFRNVIQEVLEFTATNDRLVTLGIQPTRPDTGYGYIQFDAENRKQTLYKVTRFTEKPDLQTAKKFFNSEDYLWNSGIFVWNVNAISKAFEEHKNLIHQAFEKIDYFSPKEEQQIQEAYENCENISIDYAILEQSSKVFVKACVIGWSDLGTWNSLYDIVPKDENQNVVDGNVRLYDTSKCMIKTPHKKLIVIQGLKNHIVVEKDNTMIICSKDQEQRIKEFVNNLKEEGAIQ